MIQDTLVLIKPDGIKKNITGEILSRFEQAGLQIVGVKMLQASETQADEHYKLSPDWISNLAAKTRDAFAKRDVKINDTDMEIASRVQGWLKKFLMSGLIVALVVRGENAIEVVRKLVGSTEPKSAAAGTIRGDFATDSYADADREQRPIKNIVHASGSPDEAVREIAVWFNKDVIYY